MLVRAPSVFAIDRESTLVVPKQPQKLAPRSRRRSLRADDLRIYSGRVDRGGGLMCGGARRCRAGCSGRGASTGARRARAPPPRFRAGRHDRWRVGAAPMPPTRSPPPLLATRMSHRGANSNLRQAASPQRVIELSLSLREKDGQEGVHIATCQHQNGRVMCERRRRTGRCTSADDRDASRAERATHPPRRKPRAWHRCFCAVFHRQEGCQGPRARSRRGGGRPGSGSQAARLCADSVVRLGIAGPESDPDSGSIDPDSAPPFPTRISDSDFRLGFPTRISDSEFRVGLPRPRLGARLGMPKTVSLPDWL